MNTGYSNQDLTGALPAGLGDLGPALKRLGLDGNQISELPTELGALTGLTYLNLAYNALTSLPSEIAAIPGLKFLYLSGNQLTGVPSEFRTVNPTRICYLFRNPSFSCANVGAGTSCCTGDKRFGSNCGAGLSGGPCYQG